MMNLEGRQAHWEQVYTEKGEKEVSWFEASPTPSLELIEAAQATPASAIVDIGGGASRLVDALVDRGFRNVTVLDISERALVAAKNRLGERARAVHWVMSDVTTWSPDEAAFDIWHDRAAFHFLTDENDRAAYVARMVRAIKPLGHAIIATFAFDGPERCSGLPVVRYDGRTLREAIGHEFELLATRPQAHRTPRGLVQNFQFSLFRLRAK